MYRKFIKRAIDITASTGCLKRVGAMPRAQCEDGVERAAFQAGVKN